MAIATSYNVTSTQGAREDLANLLRMVEPMQTPLFSTLKQSKAPKATLTEWLVDTVADPAISGVIDGQDLDLFHVSVGSGADFSDLINSRARLGNRVQTIRRAYAVSRQAQLVDVAPGENLMAASKAKALIELKRDIETAIGSTNDQSAGTSSAGATFAGLGTWTDPGNATSSAAATNTDNTFTSAAISGAYRSVFGSRHDVSAAASGGLSETEFRTVLQKVYEASGSNGDFSLFAGPNIVNYVSDFSRAAVANAAYRFDQDVSNGSIRLSVIEFVSDYGLVKVIPDLFLGRASGAPGTAVPDASYLIPNDDTVSLKFLENIVTENLPDLAAGPRAFVEAMLTLCVTNPRALGSTVA